MKSKFLDFIIIVIVAITIPLAALSGNWISVKAPTYYTKSEEVTVSFELIDKPTPNHEYFHVFEHHMVKQRSFFPFVTTETVNIVDKGFIQKPIKK